MTEHLKVEKSFVEALIENAAWDAAKVGLVEKKAVKEKKVKEQDDEEEVPAEEAKKVKEASKKVKEQDDEEEEMKEGVEVHTCPLCESTLEEELSDKQIREHVAQIQAALQSIDEGGDDDDDGEEPSDDDLDAIEAEPDMDEKKKKKSKKESVMKKVKELRKASKGK